MQRNNTALHWAARCGHEDVVKQLIISKADVKLQNEVLVIVYERERERERRTDTDTDADTDADTIKERERECERERARKLATERDRHSHKQREREGLRAHVRARAFQNIFGGCVCGSLPGFL